MAKSRKGKTKRFAIKMAKMIVNGKFEKCPKEKKGELFLLSLDWAKDSLEGEQYEIFITALYEAESTQETQLELAIDRELSRIMGKLSLEEKIALEKPTPLADPNGKGKSYCERELERLKKIRTFRPLTLNEEESFNYCKGTLESEEAERVYLNGGKEE